MRLLSVIFFVCFTFLIFSVHSVHAADAVTQPVAKPVVPKAKKNSRCQVYLKICRRHCKGNQKCLVRCKRENSCVAK